MRLHELNPVWLRRDDDKHFTIVQSIQEADGIEFLCPKCFVANGNSAIGVHAVICWRPRVPQTTNPIPGRWEFQGTGFEDLTLQAGSSSILLMPPSCGWHGFIRNGEVTDA